MPAEDMSFLRETILLAEEAESKDNLPIGAVIVLNGEIISRGMNTKYQPALDLTRHAEMEALRNPPPDLQACCRERSLFTTLEPCLMCSGAILLHQTREFWMR